MRTEMKHGQVTAGHLGGYVPGGDPDTHYPHLWDWLVAEQGVQSVLDVGAGDGVAVDYFLGLGVEAWGVEGIPQEHDRIFHRDFTRESFTPPRTYDLVWSCEFVEHVEEQYVDNFLATFACGDLVLMTNATPGQGGWHHVNCQSTTYWLRKLREIGYENDPELTVKCRDLAALNGSPWNHFVRSGMAYRRA